MFQTWRVFEWIIVVYIAKCHSDSQLARLVGYRKHFLWQDRHKPTKINQRKAEAFWILESVSAIKLASKYTPTSYTININYLLRFCFVEGLSTSVLNDNTTHDGGVGRQGDTRAGSVNNFPGNRRIICGALMGASHGRPYYGAGRRMAAQRHNNLLSSSSARIAGIASPHHNTPAHFPSPPQLGSTQHLSSSMQKSWLSLQIC